MSAGSARRAQTAKRVFSELLEREATTPGDARCTGCGCTDSQACPEGCYWLAVNRRTGTGVCSSCTDQLSTGGRRQ